jgi:hypothetical protein
MLIPAQEKLAYCVVIMAGSSIKSAHKGKRLYSANKLPCIYSGLT